MAEENNSQILYYNKVLLYPHHQRVICPQAYNIKQPHMTKDQNINRHILSLRSFQARHNRVNHRQFLISLRAYMNCLSQNRPILILFFVYLIKYFLA